MSIKPPTMSDVAKAAGVSRAVVSAVVNDATGNIRASEETQKRVREAAERLGYVPNPLARGLRRKSSKAIGFVPMKSRTWQTPMEHPVQYLLGTHIAQVAVSEGFHLIEASAETANNREEGELLEFMRARMVDGVVLHGPNSVREVQQFTDAGVPVVQLMRPIDNPKSLSIVVDPEPGITAAVRHLIEFGHTKIAFIGTSIPHPNDEIRLTIFRRLVQDFNLDPDDCPVLDVGFYSVQHGEEATRALLGLQSPPTAIITGGDVLALGALHAAYHLNIRVPDQLNLISFDDTFASSLYPAVTAIAQPYRQIARTAIEWIIQRTDQRSTASQPEPTNVVYPSELVIRDSTSRVQQGGGS